MKHARTTIRNRASLAVLLRRFAVILSPSALLRVNSAKNLLFPLRAGSATKDLLFVVCCFISLPAQTQSPPPPDRQFCRASPGFRFEFPRDHFSHSCFKTEWWYFTGNLSAPDGHRFGFELTFFREGVNNPYPNPSRWRIDDLYLAHFAISDFGQKQFSYTQRLSRTGIEMAGVTPTHGRIWIGNWSAEARGDSWRLEATESGNRILLNLQSKKPPVIQGKNGVSQKGPGEGNASHYYSLTRLETSGQLVAGGTSYDVTGWSWMDHEFSTSQLQPNQAGWDWVSLQMEDGSEWMFFQLRRAGGERDPYSAGSFVDRDGRATQLTAEDFQMLPLASWKSPHSGGSYPTRWRIQAPRLGFDAEIGAAMEDQELNTKETTGITYWEGGIEARGSRNGHPVRGRGYLEMTGYAGSLQKGLYSSE